MKTELNLYKRLKGLLCVTLSMVMFFGMTLGVQAEGKRYVLTCNLSSDNKYSFTDKNGKPVANNAEIRANDTIELYTSGGAVAVCINGSEKKRISGSPAGDDYTVPSPPEKYTFTTSWNEETQTYTLNLLPVAPAGNNEDSHTHSYSWRIISEATETQDGEEAYICGCGDVAEQKIVSASGFYWNEMIEKIKEAKAGDSLVFTSDTWNSFPKRVIDALAERRDITVEIQFTYQKKKWKVVIPTKAEIDTTCDWYGPEKLTQMFGRTEIVK